MRMPVVQPSMKFACCRASRSRFGRRADGSVPWAKQALLDRHVEVKGPGSTHEPEHSVGSQEAVDLAVSLPVHGAPPTLEKDEAASTSAGFFSGSLKGMILLNIGALLFGSNQVVIKITEEAMSPSTLNALRFGAAALCFLPWLPPALASRKLSRAALELGVWLTAGYTAQAYGLAQTSAAHGAFTGTFTVLAVPVLVGLSGRHVEKRTWFAACAGLLGVSLLTTSGGDPNWGDLWCMVSAVLFGCHKWRSETVTTQFSKQTTELVAAQLFVLASASALLVMPELLQAHSAVGLSGLADGAMQLPWPAILFMGIGTTALTLWIEMDALKEVSAPLAALIYTAEPLWGASFAWVLLDERWGAQGWVGAAMILTASLWSQLSGDPSEHAQRVPMSDDEMSDDDGAFQQHA